MISKLLATGVAAAVLALSGATTVSADQTGFAESHDLRRERGMTCMVDHYHYGSSETKANKAAAQRDAITSWQSFTAFEYGTDWARYGRAGSKKMTCKSAGGGGVECSVEARPCR